MNLMSVATTQQILNPFYCDVYAFYAPFRVLDGGNEDVGFQTWITGENTAGAPPLGTTLWPWNFEHSFPISSNGTDYDQYVTWRRRMYNTVWNRFFAADENQRVTVATNQSAQTAWLRPTRFETSLVMDPDDQDGVDIDVSGGTLNTDDLRNALAGDMFLKLREYYGDRYVDYLRALGVEANWAILEEPEVIGQHHETWKYRMVNATTETEGQDLGQVAGYFNSTPNLKVKRTFCPEHGLLGFYVVTRSDMIFATPYGHPTLAKGGSSHALARRLYWSPENENRKNMVWPDPVFNVATTLVANQSDEFWTRMYEDYRRAMNERGSLSSSAGAETVAPSNTNVFGAVNVDAALTAPIDFMRNPQRS